MLTILVVSLIVLILLNVPIACCLGLSSTFALLSNGTNVQVIVQRVFRGCDSTTLLAIPLFIFAGKIMERGGISRRLVDFCYAMFGWIHGSLAIVCVVGCMFFAALSGSAPATVVAIGSICAPIMIDDGYPVHFSVTLPAAAGCIGVIIPPSIPFVNYAVLSGVSIQDMFTAGFIPGIGMGLILIAYSYIMARKHHWGGDPIPFNFKKLGSTFKRSILALLFPIIILGGIYSGLFTPTESAAVACIYGIIVACMCYRDLGFKELPTVAFEGGKTNAMIFLIVATANIFSWILTTEQVPAKLSAFIMGVTNSPFVILLIINVLLLINGCFMEMTASTFIYVPILLPLIQASGINLVQFGVMFVLNCTLGLLTPPLGVNLFLATGLDKRARFGSVCKEVLPMFGLLLVILALVTYWPAFTTILISGS
ncbi:MAG: TRAP transporter large permease [Oscillospiraceae bacterium]|nr:TRAP transporter large permease [Oscillospiraceae bacterium]